MRPEGMSHNEVIDASTYLTSKCGVCGAEYRGGGECPRCDATAQRAKED